MVEKKKLFYVTGEWFQNKKFHVHMPGNIEKDMLRSSLRTACMQKRRPQIRLHTYIHLFDKWVWNKKLYSWVSIRWDLRTLNSVKSNSGFNEINKIELPAVYSTVFRCLLVVLLFFWIYCITAAPLIRGYICNKAKKKTVKRQADTKTRWNSSQLSLFHGVTNGLCEHSRACRALLFFCEQEQK